MTPQDRPSISLLRSHLLQDQIGLVILADLISEDEPKKKAEGSDDESEGAEAEPGDEPEAKAEGDDGKEEEEEE